MYMPDGERTGAIFHNVRIVGMTGFALNNVKRRVFGYKEVYFSIRRYSPVYNGLYRLFLFSIRISLFTTYNTAQGSFAKVFSLLNTGKIPNAKQTAEKRCNPNKRLQRFSIPIQLRQTRPPCYLYRQATY